MAKNSSITNNSSELFDVKLNNCLIKLSEYCRTHPHLTYLWYEYLMNNSLNENDIICCFKAIENMRTIPDIHIDQIMIFKEIITFLCDNKSIP